MEPGTRVSLACETGTQNSTDEITCLENGGWDRPVLQCARGNEPATPPSFYLLALA